MKLDRCRMPGTNVNLKRIKYLDVRSQTIKCIGENIGKTLYNIGFSDIFADLTPTVTKSKNKQAELH